MKLLAKFSAIFDRTLNLLPILASVVLMFATLAIAYEVVARYLGHPTIWVKEITEIILLYITFLGTAWLLKKEGHVKLDIVLSRLKPRAQAVLNFITSIIGAVICFALLWYGAHVTWDLLEGAYKSIITQIPYASILVIIPVGSFLLLIQFVRRAYGCLWGRGGALSTEEHRSVASH